MDTTLFVDVLLPLHIKDTYTYRVPQEYNDAIRIGQRVVVQFGSKRLYSALVRRIHNNVPKYGSVKYVLSILDSEPLVSELQFRFWEWIASYYMCYPGDVMAVALPSAFRLASESAITIHPDYDGELSALTQNELRIVQMLSSHPVLKLDDISRALNIQKIMPIIHGMIERNIIVMDEELQQRFTPRTETYLSLNPIYQSDEACQDLFNQLEAKTSTQKQLTVLLKYMQLSQFGKQPIQKKLLTQSKELSTSAINTLIKNQILISQEQTTSRLQHYDSLTSPDTIQLNEEQRSAYNYLISPDIPAVSLLHGVTSSGKTEVYIKLIQHTLQQGKQILFLLPEIALTAQIINRLRKYFGDQVGVYHSKFSASQRAEVWNRTQSNQANRYNILLGARSAIFLPFQDLGLVIIDEEHDSSYKQYDPAPRYNGRDTAIYLAHLWHAQTILGSATPSIESYFNAQQGRYGFTTMQHRYGGLQMPEVLCVDMKQAHKDKEVQGHFSKFLLDHIKEALANNEQVILFQNRRGFSLRIECDDCHWTPQCQNCDVSLVYHKSSNSLRCHYCGYSVPVPHECPACHSTHLSMKGFGTERIEDDLSILFPDAHVARLDLDAVSQKNRYLEILSDFENHRIDILVGTQMVTKGLDFENVSVVGILSADNLINFPDFRSFERSFQQMTQVSGRAGRHGHQGKVIIQSYNPWHQAIRNVIDNDYLTMYHGQITERRVFRYPPYYRIIEITLRHKQSEILDDAAKAFATQLRQIFNNRVLGPEYPSVARIRQYYLKKILIRFERTESISEAKKLILQCADQIQQNKQYSPLQIAFDVDPQ